MSELGIFYPTVPSGGGDFTIATMNVVFHDEDIGSITIYAATPSSLEIPNVGEVECVNSILDNIEGSQEFYIFLYKGYSGITINNPDGLVIGVDSGDAIIEKEDDTYYVTASGDFTLGVYSPK